MHEQDWQEPLTFDWSGSNGRPFMQEELYNSEISRILRGDFHAPWEHIEYERQEPWWNPQERIINNQRSPDFIPGKQKTPQYPRLSTLTKQQHLSGLKVLSSVYGVQPWNFPSPTPSDFETFEEIKKIYETEQNEYRLWARNCWVKGDCIRTLHPKPLLETVYDAQFELKKNEILSLPISYRMLAQISLETREEAFEFQHIRFLKSVDVKSLPKIEYPDLLQQDVTIMQEYILPKACPVHPSRFKLPDEKTTSTLPLPDIHRKLADFAMKYGVEYIATESALNCLLEAERSWKLHISVVEVVCPESGVVKKVLVLGDEVCVKKECGAQRTHIAYRHLLRNTFLKSTDDDTENSNAPSDAELSSCDFEPNELMNVNEERRRSTESLHESFEDKNNSNSPSDAELSNFGSEPNELMDYNEPQRRSTESPQVSYDDKNNSNAPSDAELSNCGSEPNELMDVNEQQRRSTHSPRVSNDDRNNSNEPSDADIYSCSSERNELIDVIEQKRGSTESPFMSNDDKNNSHEPSDAELSSCNSESSRLVIDNEDLQSCKNKNNSNAPSDAELSSGESEPDLIIDDGGQRSSKDIEVEPEVSVAVKQKKYQKKAEFFRKKIFVHLFGSDSDDSFLTEAETEEAVPHEEKKQINFAAMYTEIKNAQTGNRITLDKTTLPTETIIGENPSSREDINCMCKGTRIKVPPQRSFSKWQVNNAVSNRRFDVIIISSHKVREGETEVILEPIVEWQPELGACKQSAGRLRALALAFMIRPLAKLVNVRVDYKSGNIIVIDKLDERRFMSWHGDKRSEIADITHAVIDQLRFLNPGQYILAHDTNHGPHAMLYSAMAAAGLAGNSGHTLSLRPERDHLTESEEATLSKIPPEMSRALMPYHKAQGILPLAFTTDKNHVKGYEKATHPLARARRPPRAMQCQKKKRKAKKRLRPA